MVLGGIAAALSVAVIGMLIIPAQSQSGGTETIRLCSKEGPGFGYDKDVDVDGDGHFSAGDSNLFTDKLWNRDTEEGYGHDVGKISFIKLEDRTATAIIDVTAVLPNGKLSVYGAINFGDPSDPSRIAVVGGTGHFNNATGGLTFHDGRCLGHKGTVIRAEVTL
ncbi:MAG: hypothetical protein QOH90_1127 [Actinomycetota bacterium]|nr:hypothetical protein [Actinomycetota bacterium]